LRESERGTPGAYLFGMAKTTKRSRSRKTTTTSDKSATTDVVTQLECAIRNPHAAAIGALIGGLVPWFGRTLAHEEIPAVWSAGHKSMAAVMIAIVLGCAAFSAISVYKFGRAAFGDSRKALGFVLALEGVMLVSHGLTSNVALAVLILINAVANGSVIALKRDETKRRRAADERRAATRSARSRIAAKETQTPVIVTTVGNVPTHARPSRPARVSHRREQLAMVRVPRIQVVEADDAEVVAYHLS